MKCLKLLFHFVLISVYGGFSYCSEDKAGPSSMSDQMGDGSVVDEILMDLLPKNVDYKNQFHTKLLDRGSSFHSDLSQRSKETKEGTSLKLTPLELSAVRNLNLNDLMDGPSLLLMNEVNALKDDLNAAKKSFNGMSKNLNYDVGLNIGNRAVLRSSLVPESRSARRRKSKPDDDSKSANTTEVTPKKTPNQRRLIQSRDKKVNETVPVLDLKSSKQASKKFLSSNSISSTVMPGGTSTSLTNSASSKSPSTVAQSQMQSDSPSTHVATLKGNLAERTLTTTANSVNSSVEHSTPIKNSSPSKSVTTAVSSVHESGTTVPIKTSHADEKTTPSTTTTAKKEISTRPTQTTTIKSTSPVLETTERPHITSPHTTPSSTVRNTPRSTTHQVTTMTSAHITSTPATITTTSIKPSSKNNSTAKAKPRKSSAMSIKPLLLAILILPVLNLIFSV